MPAIVPELISMASDSSVSTTDLLRKALVVARRLAIPELVDWISGELNGYNEEVNIPDYRVLQGQLEAMNPINGPIPVIMPSAESAEDLTRVEIRQSVPELVQLAQSKTVLFCNLQADREYRLMREMQVPMRPRIRLSTVQIHGIVEKVRSRILKWALDLEDRGVVGEGMTFTPQEKKMVQQQHYQFGDVTGSQIQIGSNSSTQTQTTDIEALKTLIEVLRSALDHGGIAGDPGDELRAELATLQAQAASPKRPIIEATASSIKSIIEKVAESVVAAQVLPYLNAFLPK